MEREKEREREFSPFLPKWLAFIGGKSPRAVSISRYKTHRLFDKYAAGGGGGGVANFSLALLDWDYCYCAVRVL